MEFESYKGFTGVASESVYQFLRGLCWGTVWSLVTPLHPLNSPEYKRELATGIFKPAPPLSMASIRQIPANALSFGALVGWQRLGCRSLALIRQKEDMWNDAFGCIMVYPYYQIFMRTDRRLILHNRAVGTAVVLGVIYANIIA